MSDKLGYELWSVRAGGRGRTTLCVLRGFASPVLEVLTAGQGGGLTPWLSLAAATVPMFSAQAQFQSMFPHELQLGDPATFRDLSYSLVCRRRRRTQRGRPVPDSSPGDSSISLSPRTSAASLPQT